MLQRIQIKNSTLVLACILFAGIILTGYAFFSNNSFLIKLGVCIALITSQIIAFQSMFSKKESERRKIIH